MSEELAGLRVVSFESRRAADMARLIEKRGGQAIQAPSMREASLEAQGDVLAFGERLVAGEIDLLVLLTGVGTRMMTEVLSTRWPRDEVVRALGRPARVCRGPKPVAALKELGLKATAVAPEPNTWRELLAVLDERGPMEGERVAVQEYGARNEELLAALRRRGAKVEPVTIYRWRLPEDTAPLEAALAQIEAGDIDLALFTSAQQVRNVLEVAKRSGRLERVRKALTERIAVASIGPTTTEALRAHEIAPDLEPEHPKMGHLVAEIARRGRETLARKRGR